MMDNLTVRYILLWLFMLHAAHSYPRKYPARVKIHSEATANPKYKPFGLLHSGLDQFIPKRREVKEYNNENAIQLVFKIFSKHFNVKFNSEKILQYGTWPPKYASSKTKSEKKSRHNLKRRSVRNLVTPSSNDHHITTVITNGQNEPGLGNENQDQTNLEHLNRLEADVERDDHLSTDLPSPTQSSVTAYSDNEHSADSELDNHQATESTYHNQPSTLLRDGNNHETHLHQHFSYFQNDSEEATDPYLDDVDNENPSPTFITNNDHHEPNFQNDREQTVDQENDDINNMLLNPTVNMNHDRNDNQHHSDLRNGNGERPEQEHDNIEDLNPTLHTNSDTNRNHHNGEIPDDEDTPFQAGFHQQETTSETSLHDEQHLNMPFYNGDHIEGTVSPNYGNEITNRGRTSGLENPGDNMGPNEGVGEPEHGYTSENGNSNEEDTITRTTRNVGRSHHGDSSITNGQDNPIVNGPGNDDIPSTNTGNMNIHNNINGNPAHVENGDDDSPSPDMRGANTSQIIDHHVPSVNHPTDGSKTNQTSGNLNSTFSTSVTVKADTNQTADINATISVLTNQTTSIPLHSSQQPSESSTSGLGLFTFSPSPQTPVSMSTRIQISEQTQTISFPSPNTINHSPSTSLPTATASSPLTRFLDLITTNSTHDVTTAMLSGTITSPPTEEGRTSTIKQSSSTSPGPTGNFTTDNISSLASGQDNYTIVAGTTIDSAPNAIDSGDEIKTTIKISTEHIPTSSTETVTNITEVTTERLTPSNNPSGVLPTHSRSTLQILSPNSGNHTTISSEQVPPLTPASILSSTISTPSSTASNYITTSPSSTSNTAEESIPSTVINGSLLNGLLSTVFTRLTTKSEEISTSTTEREPKDETTSPTHAVSTSTSTSSSSTSSSTVKARPPQKPQCFMELHLSMSWSDFCHQEMSILGELVELLQEEGGREEVTVDQVQVLNIKDEECLAVTLAPNEQIQVQVYFVNKTHHFDRDLTLVCARLLSSKFEAGDTSLIQEKLLAVHLYDEFQTSPGTNQNSNSKPDDDSSDSLLNDPGVTIALVIAIVGSCCGAGLITLQTIIRRRHRNGFRMNNNNNVHNVVSNNNRSFSITSADSIQLYTVSKSAGGVINLGLNLMEPPDPTHPLNLTQLSEFCADDHKIYHEYQKLPNRLPRLSVVPTGEEDKNRYANILPLAHTRVKLHKDDNSQSSYINANYVTGPNNECQYYIATQAPTTKTINDFWTMVWQQETKAIVMLTQLEEEEQCKAATYWPELSGKSAAQRHGDFLIELKQKDVNQEYISSRLEVNNLRKIETRQIQHFWYTCWPSTGTPEPISLVKFVLDTRPRFENTGKPLIVHCSPGTGRTGTFIGLDLCMRQFESRRIVDVMKTVHDLRLERAGAVQNKEQYALLYNAINEYASIVASPVVSVASSASTLHALLPD